MSTLKDLKEMKDNYHKLIREKGKEIFGDELKKFFDKAPDIESIRWTQYTPSFNDGDPCTFSMGCVEYRSHETAKDANDADNEDVEENEGYSHEYTEEKNIKPESLKHFTEFSRIMESVPDTFEILFGDGVQVTAYRDRIEVDDYEDGYY